MKIKLLNPQLTKEEYLPKYSTSGSLGVDLRACINEPLTLFPGQQELIPTGIAIDLENTGLGAVLWPRSGMGHKHKIVLGNMTGLIDQDFKTEMFISCWYRGNEGIDREFTINPYDRIAQMVFLPIVKPEFEFVTEFENESDRGSFGSTGKN